MLVTRFAHALIIAVLALAAVAVAVVLRPERASHPPAIEFQQVVNYSKYGVIDRIDAKGQVLTVHFRDEFDTQAQLGTDAHTFESSLPPGADLLAALSEAGVPASSAGGPRVTVHQQ
jgi:hypothetical protein